MFSTLSLAILWASLSQNHLSSFESIVAPRIGPGFEVGMGKVSKVSEVVLYLRMYPFQRRGVPSHLLAPNQRSLSESTARFQGR